MMLFLEQWDLCQTFKQWQNTHQLNLKGWINDKRYDPKARDRQTVSLRSPVSLPACCHLVKRKYTQWDGVGWGLWRCVSSALEAPETLNSHHSTDVWSNLRFLPLLKKNNLLHALLSPFLPFRISFPQILTHASNACVRQFVMWEKGTV